MIDDGHTWTEEDVADLSTFALQYAATAYLGAADLAQWGSRAADDVVLVKVPDVEPEDYYRFPPV